MAATANRKAAKATCMRAVHRQYLESPHSCLTCHRPFPEVEHLYDHLLVGCWSYDDVGAILRTMDDISAELSIRRTWTRAIDYSVDHARNVVLLSLTPLFRSKKVCGQDRTGDLMSIALHAAAVETEKARTDPNHPLRNGDTFFPDVRRRATSQSLRELRDVVQPETSEPVSTEAKPVKTVFEWFANTAKTYIRHAENGWLEIVDGKSIWHGGDRNHGVTAVPTKKKGGKAKAKCRVIQKSCYRIRSVPCRSWSRSRSK